MVIAIDGPAGAGKSTVARGVAEALGERPGYGRFPSPGGAVDGDHHEGALRIESG